MRYCQTILLSLLFPLSGAIAHEDFVEVIQSSRAAVVTLRVTAEIQSEEIVSKNNPEELLGDYAIHFSDEFSEEPKERYGTGFVVDSGGLILTAAHVVDAASEIVVEFEDGTKASAKLRRMRKRLDVALISVALTELPFLRLNDSVLREGQSVVAMSGSMNLPISSAAGIISGVNRELPGKSGSDFIQTDVATNIGASGGPIFNEEGKVIGMISQIYTKTGSFSGVTYAVPASALREMVAEFNDER